jgi:phosphoribosylcarboxyaminoimidazole (NCAIR) mutase
MRLVVFGPAAAEIASAPEVRAALAPFGDRYVLAPVDAGKPWGQASTELVDLLYRGNAIGILAVGREASHLAEQLAAKVFVPVIALSADTSLTAVNLPWIFRLPAGTAPEEAIRTIAAAAEKAGRNRGRLREELAASGRFDGRGEPQSTPR